MEKPTLTILVPIRGRNEYLDITLQNLSTITDKRVEVLILDNSLPEFGSLQPFEKLSKFRIESADSKLSMTKNWYRGLTLANGEWLCFLGSDDGIVSDNLPILLDFLEQTPAKVVSTHPIFFQYQLESKQSWADLPNRWEEIWSHKIHYLSFLAVLFPQFKHDLPVPYNRCVVRTSALSEYAAQFDDIIGVSPDDFLGQYISRKLKRGVYLELCVFIHGGSERSNGMQVASKNPGQDSLDFLADSNKKFNTLLSRFGIECTYALAFEHYSVAGLALNKKISRLSERLIVFWAELFCEMKHHNKIWYLEATRKLFVPMHKLTFRIIRKIWLLVNFGVRQPIKNSKSHQDPDMNVEKLRLQLTLRQ